MVLPSIKKHILPASIKHNCDIFVHYYHKNAEERGRRNNGGPIDPWEIFLLEEAALNASKIYGGRPPTVLFVNDTDDQFISKRGNQLQKYRTTKGKNGKLLYFPWKEKTYLKSSLDNIVRQWHSIDAVFNLMDEHSKRNGFKYSRVGMLRNDVIFMTPIDVYMLDMARNDSGHSRYVVAPFSQLPVNDRMIYGPYEAVKIWSTKRFDLVEERVKTNAAQGYGMHSERFIQQSVFPAIGKLGYKKHVNPDVCFFRSRAKSGALLNDCTRFGSTRGFNKINRKKLLEELVGRKCSLDSQHDSKIGYVVCSNGDESSPVGNLTRMTWGSKTRS